jgi:hypothetical protein
MLLRNIPAAALLLTCTASADIIMEQKIESPYQNATTIMYLKGEMIRTDVDKSMSSIVDIKTGDMTSLMHAQKSVMKMTGAQMKANMEAAKKIGTLTTGAAATDAVPKITPTGKTEKFGEYDCTLYSYSYAGGTTTLWVAKNFPNYAALKVELDVMNKMPGQVMDMSVIDGMVVKTESEAGGIKTKTTLVSVKQAPVDASIFSVPAGYK